MNKCKMTADILFALKLLHQNRKWYERFVLSHLIIKLLFSIIKRYRVHLLNRLLRLYLKQQFVFILLFMISSLQNLEWF